MYDANKATSTCVGAPCNQLEAADITACCKVNDRAGKSNKNNTGTKETKENVHQINELENKLENHLVHSVFRTLVVTNVGAIRSNCMVQMPLDADLHGCFLIIIIIYSLLQDVYIIEIIHCVVIKRSFGKEVRFFEIIVWKN